MAQSDTVGWELLPLTEGIFKADKTKAKAPATPAIILVPVHFSGNRNNPNNDKGKLKHAKRTMTGKPSIICMA